MLKFRVPKVSDEKMSSASKATAGSKGTPPNGKIERRRNSSSNVPVNLLSLDLKALEIKNDAERVPSRANSGLPSDSESNLYSDGSGTTPMEARPKAKQGSRQGSPEEDFISQKTIPKLVIQPGMSARDDPVVPDSLPPPRKKKGSGTPGTALAKPATGKSSLSNPPVAAPMAKPKFQFCPNCGYQLVENPVVEPIARPIVAAVVPDSESDDNTVDEDSDSASVLQDIKGRRKDRLRMPDSFSEEESEAGGKVKVAVGGNQALLRGASRNNPGTKSGGESRHRRVQSVDHNIYSMAAPQKKGPLTNAMEANGMVPPSGKKKGKPPVPAGGGGGAAGGGEHKKPPMRPKGAEQSDDERYTDSEAPTPSTGRKGMHRRISSWADGGNLKHTDFILRKPYRDVNEVYDIHDEELGVGQFGVIRSCVSKHSGKLLACKTISKERVVCPEDAEDVRKEVQLMQQLRGHPNIIELRETFEDPKHVHFVMELCKGGELFDRIKLRGQYTEPNAAWVCQTLVEALLYCHSNGIIHRDVKPENILLTKKDDDTSIKLIDFGVATRFRHGEPCVEFVGTPYYMAPEVLEGSYGPEADIWSAGVVLYIMLCGFPPFWANSNEGIFEAIQSKEVQFKSAKWRNVSTEAKELIRSALAKDPSKRISALEILSHPWILTKTRET